MYKQLYLETKKKYESLTKVQMGGSASNKSVHVYGYSYCPYFQEAASLARTYPNHKVEAINQNALKSKYTTFLDNNYDLSKFKLFNHSQKTTSPLVIIYEGETPIMYGGCDSFLQYREKFGIN